MASGKNRYVEFGSKVHETALFGGSLSERCANRSAILGMKTGLVKEKEEFAPTVRWKYLYRYFEEAMKR
jgi:hypothetical protein